MKVQRRPATRGNTCGHEDVYATDGARIQYDIHRVRRLRPGGGVVIEIPWDVSGGTQDEVR
jgi:hypothetical protein